MWRAPRRGLRRRGAKLAGMTSLAPRVPGNVGSPNGPRRSDPFNRWFRYPAGFCGDVLSDFLKCGVGRGVVFDPFAGAATLAPQLSGLGLSYRGLEANPLVANIGHLKAGPWPEGESLRTTARQIAMTAGDGSVAGEHEVVRRCFDSEILSKLVGLREAIIAGPEGARPWMTLALTASLRDLSSSSVGWPYQRPDRRSTPRHRDAKARFLERLHWIAEDVDMIGARTPGCVTCGDARLSVDVVGALGGQPADACLTSPPYLNNYDYADATRLELYFHNVADSWASMCRVARDGMVVASTQQSGRDAASEALESLQSTRIAEEVNAIHGSLRSERSARLRGKEYDQLVVQYFADLRQVLANLYANMVPGAPLAMVIGDSAPYGVLIDTPRLLSQLAQDFGFLELAVRQIRTRGGRWRSQRGAALLGESLVLMRRGAAI